MKRLVYAALILSMSFAITGCSKTEEAANNTETADSSTETADVQVEEPAEEPAAEEISEDTGADAVITDGSGAEYEEAEPYDGEEIIPNNFMEERVGKDTFDSYDEIISCLQPGEAYAYVDVYGGDEPVLMITDYTYDNLDGNMAAIEASPYIKLSDGKYAFGGLLFTQGTATPIAVSDDGMIYLADHHEVTVECLGENGTDVKGFMVMKYVYETFEDLDDGTVATTYGGFVRDKNTVVDNDGVEVAEDNGDELAKAFEEYAACKPVNFTVVE